MTRRRESEVEGGLSSGGMRLRSEGVAECEGKRGGEGEGRGGGRVKKRREGQE